eukprot:691554-Amphidinium_carterae.1
MVLKYPTSQVRQLVAPMRRLLTNPGAHASHMAAARTPPLEYQLEGQKEQSCATSSHLCPGAHATKMSGTTALTRPRAQTSSMSKVKVLVADSQLATSTMPGTG